MRTSTAPIKNGSSPIEQAKVIKETICMFAIEAEVD